jgi:hypothetical protein
MRLARHFLAIFLGRFAWVFGVVELFLALCALLVFSAAYPYVAPEKMLAAVPDMLLLLLPLTLAFSSLVAGLLLVQAVRRAQGFLTIELAGRDPRALMVPILVFGVALSAANLWLLTCVLPNVDYALERIAGAFVKSAPMTALRAARDGGMIRGLDVSFESADESGVGELALVGEDRSTVVTARRGTFDLVDEGRSLELAARDGRLIHRDGERLAGNLSFETLRVRFDAERLAGRSKAELLELRYYTNAELERLPALASFRLHHGLRVWDRELARLKAVPAIRAARLGAAATPLLVLALVVAFLCVHAPGSERQRAILVTAACLLVVIPQPALVLSLVGDDRTIPAWVAYLPFAEVGAALLGALLVRAARRAA